MNLSVAICDDNPNEIQDLKKHLDVYQTAHDINFKIKFYTSGEQLLKDFDAGKQFHILFLDVEMSGINGIETATIIRDKGNDDIRIIFVSNYPKYMQDSFNVQAFHYLKKPLLYEDFLNVMQRIITGYEKSHTMKLLISVDGTEELININDIIYIESIKNKKNLLQFILTDRKIMIKGSLVDWGNSLNEHLFVTPYRGILVNLNYIHYIKEDLITLSTGETLPLSRRSHREIRNLFAKHILTICHH